MVEILKRRKALSVSPLKASQTLGASLAFLGLHHAIPMLHGSQGCTAFGKVFFVRHFREPIPLQTTAMDQISAVMGGDGNIVEGLVTLCGKHHPAVIGLLSTALTETQGADMRLGLKRFREEHPEYAETAIVPLSAPDFSGSMEGGFAAATQAIIDELVPEAAVAGTAPGRRRRQVNILVGAALTPADIEELKDLVTCFGLRPVVVPDLSDSLDGHLAATEFSPLTTGGTPVDELAALGDAIATLCIGFSMTPAAELLQQRTAVPTYAFDHLQGLDAVDELIGLLQRLSDAPVPERIERQRAQLQDAMLDTHFMLGQLRVAIATEGELLHAFNDLIRGMGAETVAAVVPAGGRVLPRIACEQVQIGDLEDLEHLAQARGAELLIGNSHALGSSQRLAIPLLRAGFPQYDIVGGQQRTWIGYRGSRQTLFELANMVLQLGKGEIHPYRSVYAQKPEYRREEDSHQRKEDSHAASSTSACAGNVVR